MDNKNWWKKKGTQVYGTRSYLIAWPDETTPIFLGVINESIIKTAKL